MIISACETGPYSRRTPATQSRYRYQLEITTTEAYDNKVTLKNARIFINDKEQPIIGFIDGTRVIKVPFQYINSIAFSQTESTLPYYNYPRGQSNARWKMIIRAEGEQGEPGGITIICDSIPNLYITGQESRYVERRFINNPYRIDMREIKFIERIDLNQQPTPSSEESVPQQSTRK